MNTIKDDLLKELDKIFSEYKDILVKKEGVIRELDSMEVEKRLLQKELLSLQETKKKYQENLNSDIEELKKKENEFLKMEERAEKVIQTLQELITLNIGGTLFVTTKSTLCCQKNMFYYMLSSKKFLPNEQGQYFFDRDPEYFPQILKYLRTGFLYWNDIRNDEEFYEDLNFYQIILTDDSLDKYLEIKQKIDGRRQQNVNKRLEKEKKEKEYKEIIEMGMLMKSDNIAISKTGNTSVSTSSMITNSNSGNSASSSHHNLIHIAGATTATTATTTTTTTSNTVGATATTSATPLTITTSAVVQPIQTPSISARPIKFYVKKTGIGNNGGVLFSQWKKWKVTILGNATNNGIMLGVANPETFKPGQSNYSTCGFYIHTAYSNKYSQQSDNNAIYGNVKCDHQGSSILITYADGTLRYSINGVDYGVAYSNLPVNLNPAITYIYDDGCHFEVEKLE